MGLKPSGLAVEGGEEAGTGSEPSQRPGVCRSVVEIPVVREGWELK